MKALYQKIVQVKQAKCNSNITRLNVDLDDELDLQCKKCLITIASLHSVDYYMKLHKNQDELGENFMVLRKITYNNIKIKQEDAIIFEQQPFDSMLISEVLCRRCNYCLGIFFETYNINGTAWLFQRIAINIAQVSIMSGQRDLINILKGQLQKLRPNQQSKDQIIKEGFMAEEKLITKLLKNAVDPSYPENKNKSEVVDRFITTMARLDKNVFLLQKRANSVLHAAKVLLQRYMKLFPQLKRQAREKDLIRRGRE